MDVIAWGPLIQQGGFIAVIAILAFILIFGSRALIRQDLVLGWMYRDKCKELEWWKEKADELLKQNSASIQAGRILAEQQYAASASTEPEAPRAVD